MIESAFGNSSIRPYPVTVAVPRAGHFLDMLGLRASSYEPLNCQIGL